MLLPLKWARDYLDLNVDTKTLVDALSNSGSHVESIEGNQAFKNVVVGEILEIKAHPDADKLRVCQVDIGNKKVQIVTAATNVYEGAKIPLALPGAILSDGLEIKKAKLRGVESEGMMCSLLELGFNPSVIQKKYRDAVYIFDEAEVGESASKALFIDDSILELEITPNRPDCLGVIGMSREISAALDLDLKEVETEFSSEGDILDYFQGVDIDTSGCTRYIARVLTDVKMGESPQWMKNYLMQAGIRPISNVVDLTNFVMLELNQPLHAFDLDKLKNREIVVRDAKDDEKIETLDGAIRELKEGDLLITDGSENLALAGIMGAGDSEVTESTKTILLESANFKKDRIQKTSRRIGLRSESSQRFDKGLDPENAKIAADRFCYLAQKLNIARVVGGVVDVYPERNEPNIIRLRKAKCDSLIGMELSDEKIENILNRLEIKTEKVEDGWVATAPTFRADLAIEEDLIEEIARVYGYQNIEKRPLAGELTIGNKPKSHRFANILKNVLRGCGFDEFMTYSFISDREFDRLKLDKEDRLRDYVEILNPLGEDYKVMRTTLIPGMLNSLSKNYARKNSDVCGFEIGSVFVPNSPLPEEPLRISIGFYNRDDFYFLKEVVEALLAEVGISDYRLERSGVKYLHPGVSAEFSTDQSVIAVFGRIHPEVAKNYELPLESYVAELDFEEILKLASTEKKYVPLNKYPSVLRDLSFILDRDVLASEIEEIAREYGKDLLKNFRVFDVYEGKNIEEGKKSVAFSLEFKADRTLVDSEVNVLIDDIIKGIESRLGGKLRDR